jgi:hypothetical protein
MNQHQRKLLKDYINAWPRTASMLQCTGERLEDFSDQNLLGAAVLVAYYEDLPAKTIRPFFQTNFGLDIDDLREALQLIVEHVAHNN